MFVDSHAHIEGEKFAADRDEVIARARAAGVEIIVCVGNGDVSSDSHSAALDVAEQHSFIFSTVGVHPHEATLLDDDLYHRLKELARHPKVIAIGEIGLDYHYDHSPRDIQRQAFRRQINLARELNLPAVIHTREAEGDTLEILREDWHKSGLPGIIHCFTGTRAFAEAAVDLGFLISFSGVVTFKASEDLRETAQALPLDKILIETDAPYLAPVPYRGKRNEPAYVVETARCIANLRGIGVAELGRITSDNFKRLFQLASV